MHHKFSSELLGIFFVGIFQSSEVNGGGRGEPCQHTGAAEERSVPTTADQV
jgi:hypothetical protein